MLMYSIFREQAVTDLCARFWEWRMDASPEFASYCGNHQHDDRMDDFSIEGFKKRGVTLFLFKILVINEIIALAKSYLYITVKF